MSINTPLRIVFAGTPDFSANVLESLITQGHEVCAVYCQPDRRVGRGKKLAFGPVKQLAVNNGIPVEQPVKLNQDPDANGMTPLQTLASYQADLMIVVAYGLILPSEVLNTPKYGCVNIHASLLPRWRGAAPIQRSIEAGDTQTGITIMQMDEGLDTGNMLLKLDCPISETDTGSSLHDRLAMLGCDAILQFLQSFESNGRSSLSPGVAQEDSEACYAHKLSKAEAEIDWRSDAIDIERKIRAYNAWPVSFTYVGEHRIRVWQTSIVSGTKSAGSLYKAGQIVSIEKNAVVINCGDGKWLALEKLQADGSRAMITSELLNSKRAWFTDNLLLGRIESSSQP